MSVPLMKPLVGAEEESALAEVLESGWLAQGPRVAAFERALAKRVRADHGVAVSSGTTAIHLGLLILGVGPGDEVIVPSLSHIATASVVTHVGATPVFADVELSSQNVTAQTVSAVLGSRCRAVIPVHQAGVPADIGPIRSACAAAGVDVLEDAACAIGATYQQRPVGAHSELVAVSFHPRKVITTGEGGMLLISSEGAEERVERARRLRDHGVTASAWARHSQAEPASEQYPALGFNFRMSDLQAAVGIAQLARLDEIVARRRELAASYHELLADVPGLLMAGDTCSGETNYQSFWVLLPDDFPVSRDDVLCAMQRAGIGCRSGIMAAHLQAAFSHLRPVRLPNTEKLASRSLILPLFHEMSDRDQRAVVNILRQHATMSLI